VALVAVLGAVAVFAPGNEVTVYPVIAEPPVLAGGVQVAEADALAAVAVPMVGASGTVAGVTELDAADAAPMPAALMARTVKV
jgi:hypothetical protein